MKELSPGRWEAVRGLFTDALELAEGERQAFLDRVCDNDDELRAEVESLLASHRQASRFLDPPAGHLTDPRPRDRVLEPATRLGPYQLLGEIGRGGMGTVYLAERADGAYSMRVAVKVLGAGLVGEEARLRFHGERQILADLDHPAIARLLDGGTAEDGRPYLVMELVEGEPIDRYCDHHRLDVPERMELFGRVCRAVHFAHQSLIVHRDLKPSHIVVGDGGRPKLLDFGIAKLLAPRGEPGSETTMPLARPLTPRYASPEQLRGGRITPASDVYSLGVVLYELLTGSPPYRLGGDDLKEIVDTVCDTDPLPPSALSRPGGLRRQLRGDLDAITLRALAKEPERRFASAGELADELDRQRRGEPVLTRASSLAYRLQRRLRRNKPMTAALAAVLVGGLVAGGLARHQRAAARHQVELAQDFGQQGQELALLMRQAATLPRHDVRPDRARARRRMEAIRRRASAIGPAAAAPASYALGLGHLALDEVEEARRELEAAWEGGLQTPTVANSLGETYARIYRRERLLSPPAAIADGADRDKGAVGREEALAMLARSRATPPANRHYIEAQIAFTEGDYAGALTAARRSVAEQPWRYESHYLAAEALIELAARSASAGGYELAFARFDDGRRTLDRAIEVARSDPRGWILACGLERRRSEVALDTGGGSRAAIKDALTLCDRALGIDPDSTDARIVQANLWDLVSDLDVASGGDPTPALERGLGIVGEAVDRQPDNGRAYDAAGRLHYALARWTMEHGGDPTAHLRAGEAALTRTTELLPGDAEARNSLGLLYLRRWLWNFGHGGDDTAFEQAVASFEEALRLRPGFRTARGQLGMLFARRAMLELDSSGDPEPFLSSAIRHLDEAVGTNPRDPYNLHNLGNCYLVRAMRTADAGRDPEADLEQAAARFRGALASNPEFVEATQSLAVVERVRASAAVDRGADPGAAIDAARRFLGPTAEHPAIEHELGELALAEARWQAAGGDDAAAAFAAARDHFDRSAEINPEEARIFEARARAALAEARWRADRDEDPTAAINRGLADTARARVVNPELARPAPLEGALLRLQAASEPDAARRAELAAAAVARLESGLAANPLLEHRYGPELEAARGLVGAGA